MALNAVELFACRCRRWGPCNHRIGGLSPFNSLPWLSHTVRPISYMGSQLTEENFESMPLGWWTLNTIAVGIRDDRPPISLLVRLELLVICLVRFSSGLSLWPLYGLCNWATLFCLANAQRCPALPPSGLNRYWTFGIRPRGKQYWKLRLHQNKELCILALIKYLLGSFN